MTERLKINIRLLTLRDITTSFLIKKVIVKNYMYNMMSVVISNQCQIEGHEKGIMCFTSVIYEHQ